MVAVFFRYGRLGNRLFTFSNLIAFAESKKVSVMVPAFSEYRRDFPFFDENSACRYLFEGAELEKNHSPLLMAFLGKLGVIPTVRFWEERHVFFDSEDSEDPRVQAMIESPRIIFEGWNFRSRHAIMDCRQVIKKVFKPTEAIEKKSAGRLTEAREQAEIIVGVHIRWGDYKGSERYFSKSEYVQRMSEIRALLAPGKVAFLLFGSEPLEKEGFPEGSMICAPGTPAEDLYSMAACDYIVGPPSTFSMWASFYGGHPLFVMGQGVHFNDLSMGAVACP